MNTVLKPLLCLPLFVTTVCASTNYYPEEFQDFFVETPQKIYVVVAGDKGGEDVNALVNYDTFRLRDHPTDIQVFSQFLEGKGLNDRAVKRIVSDMQRGVSSDESCGGRLSSCVPDTSDGQTKFVFDFDSSSLKIFIAPHALRDDLDEVMYESAINRQQAIVNWANLYAYTDLSQQEQVTLSNQTTLGLPMGHLYFDTEYTSSDNEFDVYTALYDVEYEDLRLQAGRNRYNPTFNSTDYLNNGASFMGDYIQLGSSTNLLKGKESAQQRIYFYAPQNGQLELYRDDRLILNKVVSEGKQYISYADLPKGAYTATLLLKVAGKTVLTETRQIVNNNQFSLKKAAWITC
uniref:CFA/I fimbrial subunit C (Colonizationfactor antigen I subunit C) n=1 Tax=Vibrio splendidus TaxID=29497 RepID=A0A0H3ZQJ5_VIBSP|nr:CFA/I fimbrial subunit C precursor (Colonizationfactor antigen I subunit C) [Vibrio splendidus]